MPGRHTASIVQILAFGLPAIFLVVVLAMVFSDGVNYVHFLVMLLIPVVVAVWAVQLTQYRHRGDKFYMASSARRHDRRRHRQRSRAGGDGSRFAGVWAGTLCVWPDVPADVLKTFPVRLLIEGVPPQSYLMPLDGAKDSDAAVVAVDVLEYDLPNGRLALEIVLAEGGRGRLLEVKLILKPGLLVSEDATDVITLELKPATKLRRRRALSARRAAHRRRHLAAVADSIP